MSLLTAFSYLPISDDINHLIVKANGYEISGWIDISLTRSLDSFPSHFELLATERTSTTPTVVLKPGDTLTVEIDGDLVLTGYLETYESHLTPNSHEIRISGASKCKDILDCPPVILQNGSPKLPYPHFTNVSLMDFASKLCSIFDVKVKKQGDWTELKYPFVASELNQPTYRIIESIARYSGVMIYDDVDGNVVLGSPNAGSMTSGLIEGLNIQAISVSNSWAQQFSDYIAVWQTIDRLADTAGNNTSGVAHNPIITRYRPFVFQSEQLAGVIDYAKRRAEYERNRRFGRSNVIRVLTDSWRDVAGKLWTPNYTVNVSAPTLGIDQNWIIASVTYHKDLHRGTVADLTIMPPEAFDVEPINPNNKSGDIIGAPVAQNNAAPGIG